MVAAAPFQSWRSMEALYRSIIGSVRAAGPEVSAASAALFETTSVKMASTALRFMVLSLSRIRIVLLAANTPAVQAFPEAPKTPDAPLLHERLRDESALVRDYGVREWKPGA